jgi:pyridoxamine 5'-phosphate oxidase
MQKITEIIYALRTDYETRSLDKQTAKPNPFEQFEMWLEEAIAEAVDEPNAMVLTTAASNGKTSARIVLLRGFDQKGFVFYTNYDSRKGREIAQNPNASLLFFWAKLERQIRIEGVISKIDRRQTEEYFASRPRESQIGAWASLQSDVIAERSELEDKIAALEKQFEGKEVPCPENWGGYVLQPDLFEFWQGRKSRLHDRLCYTKIKSNWNIERLSP